MTRNGKDLLAEIFKITKFYYFNVLPALVRCAILPREEKIYKEETEM